MAVEEAAGIAGQTTALTPGDHQYLKEAEKDAKVRAIS